MRHLNPVPGPPPLPDYPTHDGRRLSWDPWREGLPTFVCSRTTPAPKHRCAGCGSNTQPWFTAARAHPLPGETFTSTQPRHRGHREGMAVKQVRVPAWPVYAVCAFACPACHHTDLYSYTSGNAADFEPIPYMNPTLF